MKAVFLLLFFILPFCIEAQDSLYSKNGFFSKRWHLNSIRLSGKEFKSELYKFPAAAALHKKASTQKIIFYCAYAVGLTAINIGIEQGRKRYNYNSYRGLGWKTAGTVAVVTGTIFFLRSQKNIKKAVSIYNASL